MSTQPVRSSMGDSKRAIRKARKIVGMLQGTMGLEGQGLDRKTVREMTKRTAREILARSAALGVA